MARSRTCFIFLLLWIAIVIVCYYKFSDEPSHTEELSRELRDARASLQSVINENKGLRKEASNVKKTMAAKMDAQIEQVNRDVKDAKAVLDAADTSKDECQHQIELLESRIAELRTIQEEGHDFVQGGKHGLIDTPGDGPSLEHETARFKLANNIQELWYYMKSQLNKMKTDAAGKVLSDVGHRLRSIKVDLRTLSHADNNEAWREQEHAELQSLMQRRLHNLQNPKDCSKAKKLVCDLNKSCGYGCQLHHAIYCFMIAFGTERTMILKSQGWRYEPRGWEHVFLPLSETCTELAPGQVAQPWSGERNSKDTQVVVMPIVDALHQRPHYMPLSFPEDLSPRLLTLHGDPSVWFISQFVKYMMRMQPHVSQDLNEVKSKMGFKTPIVGIHVRRTDKVGTEAAFHGIEEYMEHVNEWFLIQERIPGRIDKRRVYIASDDPSVLPDARKKYPSYEFFGDVAIAQSAGMGSRYTDNSLRGLIIDIELLSLTNYLVCTFSSQVCRVAYEIMQTLHPDASQWFHSLDDIYYFGGQGGHEETVLYAHDPQNRDEIALEPGDVIGIAGNHWDGYSKGQNRKTGGIGLYPSYKTEDKRVIVKYPIYAEVPLTET